MYTVRWSVCVLVAVVLGSKLTDGGLLSDGWKPVLVNKHGDPVSKYHGWIREDQRKVELKPALQAEDKDKGTEGLICGYDILHHKDNKIIENTPFEVVLTDRKTGAANIQVKKSSTLDYETKDRYEFRIRAYDCNKVASDAVRIVILVEDQNEFAPEFEQSEYDAEIQEGIMYDKLLQVSARDKDASDDFGKVCQFEIVTPGVPFDIDKHGNIFNTKKLNYKLQHNYIFKVKALDCGMKLSESAIVNIKVKPTCHMGWKGISDRIEYQPGSGQKHLFDNAEFEMCSMPCKEEKFTANVRLTTDHIAKGCDRDTYSMKSQRILCGASSQSIDLLPLPALGRNWTAHLPSDDGHDADTIFAFDGKNNAVEVPRGKVDHKLGKKFSILTWMKHEENPEDDSKHGTKEHILCMSDGEKMNRHHYSLFVHNCRLVLLFRQESDHDLNKFWPAEYRWTLPQVCDGGWHHYAINVDHPHVNLYVDGSLFVKTKSNPEIIDDWPLHPTKKIHSTNLYVGACYQAKKGKLDQYFRGYLAGLTLLKDKMERDTVIKCLTKCEEKLTFQGMGDVDTGMSVAFNSEMSEITVSGHSAADVQRVLKKISYENMRSFPTVGHRNLEITTDVKCTTSTKVTVPDVKTYVMVLDMPKPTITISGSSLVVRPMNQINHGLKLFDDIKILTKIANEEDNVDPKDINKLDECLIHANPPLTADEELTLPLNLMQQLNMDHHTDSKGVVISGADKIYNYEDVLHQVHYYNRVSVMKMRSFTVKCSEQNRRFESNEFTVKIDATYEVPKEKPHAFVQANRMAVEHFNQHELNLEEKENDPTSPIVGAAHTNAGIIVIIVICVGFLMFMIVLGVIRIRAAHNRNNVVKVEENPEMEWDNSALNIIVNPMDDAGTNEFEDQALVHGMQGDESDSDDDISSYHDELESSEDESEKIKDRELEWDDSTLTF